MKQASGTRAAVALVILLAVSTLVAASNSPLSYDRAKQSSWDIIQIAVDTGLLTQNQGSVYKGIALFQPERLPAWLRGERPGKCGTPALVEIEGRWQALSASDRAILGAWPAAAGARGLSRADTRPILSGPEQTLSTPHFIIHYTLIGADAVPNADANANGIPDYADAVANAMETSRTVQVNLLGWLEPPSDEPVDYGSPFYDVFVQQLSVQGLTFPEIVLGDNEHSVGIVEPFARCSYIILHSQLDNGLLEVTAAHEYNHAIQFGYNAAAEGFDARRWLMEGTATWIEDQVYPDVNDNIGYLPRLFSAPDRSLVHPDNHYASWLFFQYIQEHRGGQAAVRNIWQRSVALSGDFSVRVVQQTLQDSGADLRSTFTDFCITNLLMLPCELSPGAFCYEHALLYRGNAGTPIVEGNVNLKESEAVYLPPDGVQPLACDYVRVHSTAWSAAAAGYSAAVEDDLEGIWSGRSGFSVDTLMFPINSNPDPPSVWVSPIQYDSLHIIITNATDPTDLPLTAAGYGLILTALEESPPAISPTPTLTPAPTATPTPTSSPSRRLWLPAILRG